MKHMASAVGHSVILFLLTACAEGRWVHPTNSPLQTPQDWEACKEEVLAGQEHRKDTMAGGINLSGCMQAKGYSFVQGPSAQIPTQEGAAAP